MNVNNRYIQDQTVTTSFKLVSKMNESFKNPKGDPNNIEQNRIHKQCLNIADEYGEIMVAMGADPLAIKEAVAALKRASRRVTPGIFDLDDVRDGLCDIHVFAYGAHHYLGINADDDMKEVVHGVMTRFIKNDEDKQATIKLHAAKGVTEVYFEGKYPEMIMKSAIDQPDAPKGKFLKSASYQEPIFRQY